MQNSKPQIRILVELPEQVIGLSSQEAIELYEALGELLDPMVEVEEEQLDWEQFVKQHDERPFPDYGWRHYSSPLGYGGKINLDGAGIPTYMSLDEFNDMMKRHGYK